MQDGLNAYLLHGSGEESLGAPSRPAALSHNGEADRRAEADEDRDAAYFSPTLNGGSLPGGVVSSAIASSIATMT